MTRRSVRAAMAGEVIRLRRNDAGYGRAVYVRHADGQQTVYAHLSAFASKLAAEIRAREGEGGPVLPGLQPAPPHPGGPGVGAGYAGTSGTDLVHLHFELRCEGRAHQPADPRAAGARHPGPRAAAGALRAPVGRGPCGRRAGRGERRGAGRRGRVAEPVRLDGDVVLYVEAADHIDGSPRDLTPYRIDLEVDGQPWHTTRYDEVSYADDRYTELDFHLEREARKEARFNALFSQGPRARVHAKAGRSLGRLKRGRHTACGSSRPMLPATAPPRPQRERPPPSPCAVAIGKLAKGKTEPPPADRRWRERLLVIPIEGLCGVGERLDVQVTAAARSSEKAFESASWGASRPSLWTCPPTRTPASRWAWPGFGGRPAWVRIDSHGLKGAPGPEEGICASAWAMTPCSSPSLTEITRAEVNPGGPGLDVVGPLYRMSNRFVPAKAFSRVALRRPPGGTGHVGVYTLDGERWWYLGG
ncbi:MAG: peptidoglycan DD-metalloendopeptidase family protein [bacterium]